MTLRDLLASFRKHLMLVVATTVLATVLVGVVSHYSEPVYRSSASLYFSLSVGQSASDLNQGNTYTQNQMLSFAQLATMPIVLDPVIESLGLDTSSQQLASSVSASRAQDTSILDISAASGSAATAAEVANAVAAQLVVVVEDLALRDANGDSTVNAKQVKDAQVPLYPIAPNTKRNVLAGFVVGILGGLLLAYLRDVLDTRVRRPDDVTAVAKVPVLGQISRIPGRSSQRPAVVLGVSDSHAEEFRRLRTNLRFLSVDTEGLCLVISSAMPGEGKTTASVNLAVALAEADMRVLLVDADMRRPRIADYMGLENNAGLTTVLIGRATVDDVIQPWGGQRLDVLTAGEIPPNPSELVATRALRDLLEDVRARYDVVIIDAPPLLPVADAAILSRMVSGVVVVADTKKLRRHQLREVVDGVHAAGGQVLGVVLNKVKVRRASTYGYSSHEIAGQRHDAEPGEGGESQALQVVAGVTSEPITPVWPAVGVTASSDATSDARGEVSASSVDGPAELVAPRPDQEQLEVGAAIAADVRETSPAVADGDVDRAAAPVA